MCAAQRPDDSTSPAKPSLLLWIVGGAIAVGISIAVWIIWSAPAPVNGPGVTSDAKKFSNEERSELLGLRQQAIGYLENDNWTEALRVLKLIGAKLPDDLFVPRNTAVAMCGKNIFGGTDPHPIQPEEAEAAAQRLLEVAPTDYTSHLLAARIAIGCRQQELAQERFQKAVELAPNDPNAWFEMYRSYETSFSKETPEKAIAAIEKCYKLAPENSVIVTEYAIISSLRKDPALLKTLQDMVPYVESLRRFAPQPNLDPKRYLDEALRLLPLAMKSNAPADWSAITTQLRFLPNAIKGGNSDVYKADLAKVIPNPLEFMLFRFATDELNGDPETASQPPGIEVTFVPAKEQIAVAARPLCVQIADYNIDQQPDLFVLTQGKLQIFGFESPVPADAGATKSVVPKSQPWRILADMDVDPKFTGFAVADLDLDASDVSSPVGLRPVPDSGPAPKPQQQGEIKPGDATAICQQADPDLILYGPTGVQVWKNEILPNKQRAFVQTENTGLEAVKDVEQVWIADFDLEGDLDLIIGFHDSLGLWSNRERFTFKDVSQYSTLPKDLRVRQILPVDWDHDVDLDFIVVGEVTAKTSEGKSICGVLRNQLHGKLKWDASLDGGETDLMPPGAHAALLDADSNTSWDLVISSRPHPKLINTITRTPGNVRLLEETPLVGVLTEGVRCLDYDNDGYLDLLSWNDKSLQISRGSPAGRFSDTPLKLNDLDSRIRDCQSVDFDNDGDLDLVVSTESGVNLLANEGGNQNHWLKVRLRARPIKDSPAAGQAKRVNHQGVGSLVELKTQTYYQPQVATGEVIHFGLGQATNAELLRIVWTNGVPQGRLDLKGNVEICENQSPKGSCPFVYTWNGEHFEFYTDLLWNAPLGLQFAEGVVAQPRAWEYLKIDGDRMKLKDGKFVMQVTEELWEATYFDQIELLAVDHPADIEIYSNEKVGPPELAEFKIHTVRDPRPPVSAVDQKGRDLLHEVLQRDGEFTKGYDHRLRQGLTDQHWLELDLGPIDQPGPITLFLTGWMYPTETSISVAVSQNAENAQARPPALWVPNAQGEWKEIRPFMGFPGGKTKTIAIDLTDAFAGQDHRLRVVTNMEFYWDHAFYTVGERPVGVTTTPMKLLSADLHFRGVSEHYWRPGNGPDQYDYRHVTRDPIWPPMQGKFTRYGDVLELLTQQDDRLAVVGAGDEITLTFDIPEAALPEGWKRDFIMHNVGWDKDADLHTLQGQTVEPLPFNAMSGYPFAQHETPVETSEYRRYLDQFQTREQSHSRFWHLVKEHRSVTPTLNGDSNR